MNNSRTEINSRWWNDTRKVEVHYGSSNIKKFARSTPRFLHSKGGGSLWIYLTNSSGCSPSGLERMDYDVLYSNHRESFGKRTSECLPINLAGHNARRKKREKVKSSDGKFVVRL